MSRAEKKKIVSNIIMVALILMIVFSGLMAVGELKGWFDKPSEDGVTVSSCSGTVSLCRSGIAYQLKDGAQLRAGDVIETFTGASVAFQRVESRTVLYENSRLKIESLNEGLSAELEAGKLFAKTGETLTLCLMNERLCSQDAVLFADAPYGSAGVSIVGGSAELGNATLNAGERASILSSGVSKSQFMLESLSTAELETLSALTDDLQLCTSPGEASALIEQRETERRSAVQARLDGENERIDAMRKAEKAKQSASEVTTVTEAGRSEVGNIAPPTAEPTLNCTIEIRCDTILGNLSDLSAGKEAYVPSNGVILAASAISFTDGETVFDVLRRACQLTDIQLEYSWTPLYDSYYVEGINNLYEKDCGELSGWMFKVNGWFPNYGCSKYTLNDGDLITWCYTCKGAGADVGGSY